MQMAAHQPSGYDRLWFPDSGRRTRIPVAVRSKLLVSVQKNRLGLEEMGKIPFAGKDRYELTVRCVADRIDVYEHDKLLLSVCDNTYTHGMTGFAVRDGARAAFRTSLMSP